MTVDNDCALWGTILGMDTMSNETRLARIRAAIAVINHPDASAEDSSYILAVDDLATQMTNLDASLTVGGSLPSYWSGATK